MKHGKNPFKHKYEFPGGSRTRMFATAGQKQRLPHGFTDNLEALHVIWNRSGTQECSESQALYMTIESPILTYICTTFCNTSRQQGTRDGHKMKKRRDAICKEQHEMTQKHKKKVLRK